MNKINFQNQLSILIGSVLYFVSTIMSIKLLVQFAETGFDQFLYSLVGAGFQTAMAILFVRGIIFARMKEQGKSVIAYGAYAFLLCLSLAASLGFFISSSHDKQQHSIVSDNNYTRLQEELSSVNKLIEDTENQINEMTSRQYFTHGVKPARATLEKLLNERKDIMEKLSVYQVTTSGDQFFLDFAAFFDAKPDKVRFIIFCMVAIAIDLVGAILIGFGISEMQIEIKERNVENEKDNGVIEKPKIKIETVPVQARIKKNVEKEPEIIIPKFEPEINPAKAGFTQPVKSEKINKSDNDIVIKYINALFPEPERPGKSLKSRLKIADELNITNDKAAEIHNMLKDKGLIDVRGQRTYALSDKQEMLRRV